MSGVRTYKPGRGLVANSLALLATSHITTLLGFLFWTVCAKGYSASTVGMTNTVISAMSLVAVLTATGFQPFLTRVLPGADPEERSGLCGTAILVSIVVSGAAGVVGAVVLPERVHTTVGTGWLVGLVGAGGMSTAVLLLINAALLGVRRADLSMMASVLGSLTRLVVVAALLGVGVAATMSDAAAAHTILTVWVVSLVLSIALGGWLLVRATPGFRLRVGRVWLSRLRRGLAWDHLAMVAGQLPVLTLPILAAALFPPALVGYATIAMLIAGAFSAVSALVSNALLAHCADRPENLRTETSRAVRLIAVLLLPPLVITCLLAPKILGLFGSDYARYSTLLVLLLVASLPNTLTDLALASLRVQRRLVAAAAIAVAGSTMTIGGSLLLWFQVPQWGITGAGVAALGAALIIASTLGIVMFYRRRVSARAVNALGDPFPPSADETPGVDAPLAEVSLLSHAAPGQLPDESPPGQTIRSGHV